MGMWLGHWTQVASHASIEKCSQAHLAWFFKCVEIQAMVFRWKKPIAFFQGCVASNEGGLLIGGRQVEKVMEA